MEVDKLKLLVVELIGLMNENDLGELEIEEGGSRVRLKKAAPDAIQTTVVASPGPAAPANADAAATASESEQETGTLDIPSPIVGTFYRSPGPESESFVHIDDEVDEETVVCIIEAMKVMNEIKAEVSGRIVAILVENGEPVEFGQPLFRVKQEG